MAEARVQRLEALVAEAELDLVIVGDLVRPGDSGPDAIANIRWLTGFTGTSGFALVGSGRREFLTDFRYTERAAAEVAGAFERGDAVAQQPDVPLQHRQRHQALDVADLEHVETAVGTPVEHDDVEHADAPGPHQLGHRRGDAPQRGAVGQHDHEVLDEVFMTVIQGDASFKAVEKLTKVSSK